MVLCSLNQTLLADPSYHHHYHLKALPACFSLIYCSSFWYYSQRLSSQSLSSEWTSQLLSFQSKSLASLSSHSRLKLAVLSCSWIPYCWDCFEDDYQLWPYLAFCLHSADISGLHCSFLCRFSLISLCKFFLWCLELLHFLCCCHL